MSAQGQITDFLKTLSPGEKGYVPITPNQIALQTGINRDSVNKTLYNLMTRKRIELLRAPNGRQVIGFKPLDFEPRQRGTPSHRSNGRVRYETPVVESIEARAPRRPSVSTPALDEYAKSKSKFEQMKSDFGDLIEATFKSNAYAEEGLRLRERLASIEAQLIDVRQERDEMARDNRDIRARKQAAMTEEAIKAGAVVQHSAD